MLLEPSITDRFDVFLWNDPPGTAGARIEGQKVWPRLVEPEADMSGIGCFDRRNLLLDQRLIGAAIALEGELDVLGGDRLAIVKFGTITQHKIPAEAILRHRPRLGERGRIG